MSKNKELEAFERECKLLGYCGNMEKHHIGDFYLDSNTNWMWQMWLSSVNRNSTGDSHIVVEL